MTVETEVVSGSVAAVSRAALERIGPMDEQFFLYIDTFDVHEPWTPVSYTHLTLPTN